MKEQITGFLLKCDKCGTYMDDADCETRVFLHDDEEIPETLEACMWATSEDGQTHTCYYCLNPDNDGE